MKRKFEIKGEIPIEDVRRILRVHYMVASDPAIEAEVVEIIRSVAAVAKRKDESFDVEAFMIGCGIGDSLERLMVKPKAK